MLTGMLPWRTSNAIGVGITYVVLVLLIILALGQAVDYEFLQWDDPIYVSQNAVVQNGLTLQGIKTALTSRIFTHWHPITMLSLMLDTELYGHTAAGYHVTNLILHIVNAILVYRILLSMTGARLRCMFVALLFAVHPLRVESVVWISERKDVLSTFFVLLSTRLYIAYVTNGGAASRMPAIASYTLGVLSKATVVYLPLLWLLLDFWPLGRIGGSPSVRARASGKVEGGIGMRASRVSVIIEKWPFWIISGIMSTVALRMNHLSGEEYVVGYVPLPCRLANAVVNYVLYIKKMLFPVDLSALYLHPNLPGGTPWSEWHVLGAGLLLLLISLVIAVTRRRYALVGWIWFLVAMLPMNGVAHLGKIAMADRYTYVPSIGLSIVLIWGGAELYSALTYRACRCAFSGLSGMVLVAMLSCTRLYAQHWRDSDTFFKWELSRNPRNCYFHNNMGALLYSRKCYEEAIEHYQKAVAINPDIYETQANLAMALMQVGAYTQAEVHLRMAREAKMSLQARLRSHGIKGVL